MKAFIKKNINAEVSRFWYIVAVFSILFAVIIAGVFIGSESDNACKEDVESCSAPSQLITSTQELTCAVNLQKELWENAKISSENDLEYIINHETGAEIAINYPVILKERVEKRVHQTLAQSACDFMQEIEINQQEYKTLEQESETLNPANHSYAITATRVNAPHTYVSFIYNYSGYTGGAHGFVYTQTEVFKGNGEVVKNIQEFNESFTKEALQEKVAMQLATMFDKEVKAMMWTEDALQEEEIFDTWYVNKEGDAVVIFDPYTIGPWVLGTIEVEIK